LGDLTEAEYRKQKIEIETRLTALSEDDKVVRFDRHRAVVRSLPDAIATASKDKLQ